VADLPAEVVTHRHSRPGSAAVTIGRDEILFDRMTRGGESFWKVVYEPFMAREITRDELLRIVHHGLEVTRGSYRGMVQLFNLPVADYRRMLNFLRKHNCVLPFRQFRDAPNRVPLDPAAGNVPGATEPPPAASPRPSTRRRP
jgi:hypothetical protein